MTRRSGYIKVPQGLPISQGKNSMSEAAYDWLALKALNQLPSQRELSRKWGWTLYKTRRFIAYLEVFNQSSNNFQSPGTGSAGGVEDTSNNYQSPINQSPSTPPEDRDASEPLNQYITIGGGGIKYACEGIGMDLHRSVVRSADCRRLLGAWLDLYTGAGHTVECILAKDLGVCSSVVRKGNLDGALLVLDWLYHCPRSKPRYLRDEGHLHLHNVCNKKVYAENFSLARAWKSDTIKTVEQSASNKQQQQQQQREPRYDKRGFLIDDTKE